MPLWDASAGSYTLSGQAVGLGKGSKLTAAAGAYTLTGSAVGLGKGYLITALTGSFALTGQSVGLAATRKITAGVGSFVLTGQDVTLAFSTGAQSLGLRVPYTDIALAIKSLIATNVSRVNRVEIEHEFVPDESWVGIYRTDRAAPADMQRMSNGKATRFVVRHSVVCWRYSLDRPSSVSLRNDLVGDVERALMLDRTLGGTCETSWTESGSFMSIQDSRNTGAFWGGCEINLLVDVTARVN